MGEGSEKGEAGVRADRRMVLGALAAGAGLAAAGAAGAISLPGLGGGGDDDAATATTQYGRVGGEAADGVISFKGIPYGAPTSGGARFMPPQPPRTWGGVKACKKFGDQCPQESLTVVPAWSSWQSRVGESEDCLSLNVWTPALRDGKKRPVMVWMHGGLFSQGNGAWPVYDGARLAQRGDVVVVTLNHRLNVFGYLYLAGLDGAFADSGNIGQLDLIAALQWVRDNITEFGGDPGRVTVFGQSGGAGKVAALMAMPAAKGLFHRAAIQSDPSLTAIKPEDATAAARAVCEAAHVNPDRPGGLQGVLTDRLVDAIKAVAAAGKRLGPVVDGRNLTRDPFSPDAPAGTSDVPVLVGFCATETTLRATPETYALDFPGLKARLAPMFPGADMDRLVTQFRQLRPGASASDLWFHITTLRGVGAVATTLAERKAALNAAGAYAYRVEFETPVDRLKSPHALDIPLVFDNVAKSDSLLKPVAADAQKVADQMSAAWIAFARTGSPNAPGLSSWPRYDGRSRATMLFNVTSRAVNDPYPEERAIMAALPPATPQG
jgi:para-nitrobenzyl esterase